MNGLKQSITWPQILNGWPLLAITVTIILSYATLITRITVVENKIDNVIALLEKTIQSQERIVANLNDLNKRVVVVETEHAMNRR